MTDPRYTDPIRDPNLSDPVLRREQGVDRMWGWIAGIAVVVLIAFILVAGWNSSNTASNAPSSTTGSATNSAPAPAPAAPAAPRAPAAPAPSAPAR